MRVSFLTWYEGDTWYMCVTRVHTVTVTCHMVHVFMLWHQYVVTWHTCSCCDSNMSHGTRVHAVTAICCHMVHVFMLWQQHVTWYTCSCCYTNMLSHGTRVHAVTATCHMVHMFMLWQQHVTRYTCSCCESNMLSQGTRVHAVTPICCHMSTCPQVLTERSRLSRLDKFCTDFCFSIIHLIDLIWHWLKFK
jgi:hypothetical protein